MTGGGWAAGVYAGPVTSLNRLVYFNSQPGSTLEFFFLHEHLVWDVLRLEAIRNRLGRLQCYPLVALHVAWKLHRN